MINAGTVAAYLTLDTSSFDSGINSALMSISGFNAGAELIKGASERIKYVMESVGGFLKNFAASAVNGFAASWKGIAAAVSASRTSITAACGSIAGSVSASLGRLPSIARTLMIQTGQGMIAGLAAMRGSILATAQSIANAVAGKIRAVLGIHSPSRVMMEIGKFTVAGMALGMSDNLDMIKKEAERASKCAAEGINQGLAFTNSLSAGDNLVGYSGLSGDSWKNGKEPSVYSYAEELGQIAERLDRCIRLLAQNNTSLEIDGRSFGRLVSEYI